MPMHPSLEFASDMDLSTSIKLVGIRGLSGLICSTEGCTQSSATCAKFLGILGIFGIFGISGNIIIISTMMLHITTYIVIDLLSRVIRTYITFFMALSILILTLKTNNLDDMSRYTLNLALNSRLR